MALADSSLLPPPEFGAYLKRLDEEERWAVNHFFNGTPYTGDYWSKHDRCYACRARHYGRMADACVVGLKVN